jgi:hypothetical protein
MPQMEPPPLPQGNPAAQSSSGMMRMGPAQGAQPAQPARMQTPVPHHMPQSPPPQQYPMATNAPPMSSQGAMHPQASIPPLQTHTTRGGGSAKWLWWVVALLALGAATGAVLALVLRH